MVRVIALLVQIVLLYLLVQRVFAGQTLVVIQASVYRARRDRVSVQVAGRTAFAGRAFRTAFLIGRKKENRLAVGVT